MNYFESPDMMRVLGRIAEIAAHFAPSVPSALLQAPAKQFSFASALQQAAATAGVEPDLVAAVVQAESGGDPRAVSPAGALGLMQLMPQTARALGVTEPFDPAQNLAGGARYLRQMLDRFDSLPLALAAYNAGPGAVERHKGIPPYSETRHYVRRVLELYQQQQSTAPQ